MAGRPWNDRLAYLRLKYGGPILVQKICRIGVYLEFFLAFYWAARVRCSIDGLLYN
jgi:hypothetical protein